MNTTILRRFVRVGQILIEVGPQNWRNALQLFWDAQRRGKHVHTH